MIGESQVTCEGANWSPEPAQCVPESLFGEGQCSLSVSTTEFGYSRRKRKRRVAGFSTDVHNDIAVFQVAIYDGDQFKCGGTLISNLWVLTAAHCIMPSKNRNIRVFGNVQNTWRPQEATELGVDRVVTHPRYNRLAQWDIGLIKVRRTLPNFHVQDRKSSKLYKSLTCRRARKNLTFFPSTFLEDH